MTVAAPNVGCGVSRNSHCRTISIAPIEVRPSSRMNRKPISNPLSADTKSRRRRPAESPMHADTLSRCARVNQLNQHPR